MELPAWAEQISDDSNGRLPCYRVDAHKAYPAILKDLKAKLGAAGPDPKKPTQYWLEVAYQCMKMDMQVACGFAIEIHLKDRDKKYALAAHPDPDLQIDDAGQPIPGTSGVERATQGREAREHYKAIRGFIPA